MKRGREAPVPAKIPEREAGEAREKAAKLVAATSTDRFEEGEGSGSKAAAT